MDFDSFLILHKPQLELSNVPQLFWDSLHAKVTKPIFDAGNAFTLLKIDYEDGRGQYDPAWTLQIHVEEGIKKTDPSNIFLIDHAWTFRIEDAKKQLETIESLRNRMALIMDLENVSEEQLCEEIFDEMWKYCDCYWTQNAEDVEDRIPIWYILDEVGSAVHHSNTPNCRIVPFLYIPERITYSLIFPIKDIACDEIITRNFVEKSTGAEERAALLLPWVYTSFQDNNFTHEKPSPDYFFVGHAQETLPILSNLTDQSRIQRPLKVYSEYTFVNDYLTDSSFVTVENEEDADILWLTTHFKNFEELSFKSKKYINQFPFEYVLTNKDLLSVICTHNSNGIGEPFWLPITYNLQTELSKFVSYYKHRENRGLNNHWIIKPYNLARGLDTHITNNLNYILRLPATGPKIAQKYIDNPVLFFQQDCLGKVKFDVRYVILLKSINPLEVYVYKNFFLRFANDPFEMKHFERYSKHFTVMNYIEDGKNLKHMLCSDFINEWQKQYPDIQWSSIERSILSIIYEIFKCATKESPPCGISESPQSRALYAADILLEWSDQETIQPKLLEINWMPDCERACKYYPDFFNDIFKLLFLDCTNDNLFYDLKFL
ncbi:hypothetical protein RN001_000526 [Aquatica leii]|uniref:Tubulin--tyrosine ligase-like protein 12 SET-like domain-containing protein n=1 Tax=Aquatica leii TaxID=1421715 RepID=A0AAN7Q9Q2_9COLE|nr:hypothetical protein RN001_000526 [Aquatica leii]